MIGVRNGLEMDWISKAKGFGILGVVAVHTVLRFTVSEYLTSVACAGRYCVQLFFVISAYLTFISLERNKEPLDLKSYLMYFGHKLVRLIPVLYTAVLWHIISYSVLHGGVSEINTAIWKDAFFAVTFLNGFSVLHINPWLNWYIGDLVIYYAIAPFLFHWIDTFKKSVWFFIVTMVFAWLSNIVISLLNFDAGAYFCFWLPNQLPVLAIGTMLYHFQKSSFVAIKNSILTLLFVISSCLLLSLSFFTTPMEIHVRYGLFLLVFVYTLFNYSGRMFNWLKILGNYSYGIYLYHWCLLSIFDSFMNRNGISRSSIINFICYYVLLVLISLLIAKLANMVFEKPFFGFTKRVFGI